MNHSPLYMTNVSVCVMRTDVVNIYYACRCKAAQGAKRASGKEVEYSKLPFTFLLKGTIKTALDNIFNAGEMQYDCAVCTV